MLNKIKKLIIIFLTFNPKLINALFYGVAAGIEHIKFFKVTKNIKTLVDVGSNKGQFGLITRHFFPNIFIHSIEPQTDEIELQKKVLGNIKIKYYNYAAGSANEEKTLKITKRKDSSSLLEPNIDEEIYNVEKKIIIKVKRIENIINISELQNPILVKLDIQGYELEALKGLGSLLNKIDYVLIEVSFQEAYLNQPLADDIIKYLKTKNFKLINKNNETLLKNQIYQQDMLFKNLKYYE